MADERIPRTRINGYLHPDVVSVLEDDSKINGFRSIMPMIELYVKERNPIKLNHVNPGVYGATIQKAVNEAIKNVEDSQHGPK